MSIICECCAGKTDEIVIEELKERSLQELHQIQRKMNTILKATLKFKEACDAFKEEDLLMMEIRAKSEGLEMPEIFTPKAREEQQMHMKQVIHRCEKGLRCLSEAIKSKVSQSNTTQ